MKANIKIRCKYALTFKNENLKETISQIILIDKKLKFHSIEINNENDIWLKL